VELPVPALGEDGEWGEEEEFEEVNDDSKAHLRMSPERMALYEVKVAGTGKPEWLPAISVGSYQLAPGMRQVTLEVEMSREKVPLAGAYVGPGQTAAIKIGDSDTVHVGALATPPFTDKQMHKALMKLRGDTPTGETRTEAEAEWSQYERIDLVVSEQEQPELYNLAPGDAVSNGHFRHGSGMDVSNVRGIYTYPTVLIFAEGTGIATARAMIEAKNGYGGLALLSRADVRLYYRADSEEGLCYQDKFAIWEETYNTKVRTTTGDFEGLFDEDDVEYDPLTTAVLLCGPRTMEADMAALLEEMEVPARAVCRSWVAKPHPHNNDQKRKFTTRMPKKKEVQQPAE